MLGVKLIYLHIHWWRTSEEIKTKCGQQKAIIYTVCNPLKKTPNVSGIQAKQLGSNSLRTEHAYIKMLWIHSKRNLKAFTILLAKKFTFILLICLFIYVYIYIHVKYMFNILFSTGRCLWVNTNYQKIKTLKVKQTLGTHSSPLC